MPERVKKRATGCTTMILEPISAKQEQQVRQQTTDCLRRACELFDLSYDPVPVHFDLRGRAAGMYQVRSAKMRIRYNPYLFAKYFDENLRQTVPHEVAHHIAGRLFGLRCIRPHGEEWRMIMRTLGVEPRVTAEFDLTGIPLRRQRRYTYVCHCREFQLSSRRHNRINRHKASYHCRACGSELSYVGPAAADAVAGRRSQE